MSEQMSSTQVVVVGGGPGGYAAAFMAADLGLKTALIDLEVNPGGVCLYRGCIPSKALLHAARVLTEAQEATHWGIDFGKAKIDLDKLREWKNSVVQKLTGGLGQLSKQRKVTFIQGRATFLSAHTLKIEKDGGEEHLAFEHAIVATGSRPAVIPSLSLDSPRVMDSTSALELADIPKTMLVIGGGYIGLELGTVYAALGTQVSVVEMMPGLLPGADRDLVNPLAKRMQGIFKSIMLNTTVVEMNEEKKGIRVKFQGAEVAEPEQVFEKVLVSVGRKPNTSGLGLEHTQVEINPRGFINVDAQCRTAEPSIYAIGDVVGEPMLAHKATHEGKLAAEVIAGHKAFFDARTIPSVAYTDPEIAWMGLTEPQAKAQGIAYERAIFPWAASGRALSMGRDEGLTKLILDKNTRRILGAGIVGVNAGELIAEAVLALEMGAEAADIGMTIHPHPTLSETLGFAAEIAEGSITDLYLPKR
jgi:dihydrolipoamide dehydrogenase